MSLIARTDRRSIAIDAHIGEIRIAFAPSLNGKEAPAAAMEVDGPRFTAPSAGPWALARSRPVAREKSKIQYRLVEAHVTLQAERRSSGHC
jgi:hypothetical protein